MKIRFLRTLPAVLLVALVHVSGALAQDRNDRTGFYIGLGLGGGGISFQGEDKGTFLGSFFIGGGLTDRWLLMGEALSSMTEVHDDTATVSGMYLSTQYFVTDQFYVRPGVGFASADVDNGSIVVQTDTGFSALGAVGYEFRLTRSFALSPEAKFAYSRLEGDDYVSYGAVADLRWYF